MRNFFKKSHDGGEDSGVTGYWLIEWKRGFSIVLLRFSPGTREAFHSHAFNALTWWLKGGAIEHFPNTVETMKWKPSIFPKYTPRTNMHKIESEGVTWALSIRGPWHETWKEVKGDYVFTLTKGREIVGWERL